MQIRYLDGPRLKRSLIAACEYAQQQRSELNRINVFPVPDGDTGTNLALTVRAVADHLRPHRERSVSSVAKQAAQGAVLGARGNCGMMLSHFLLGFADAVEGRDRINADEFGSALSAGVRKLHSSLEDPIEGTILTVMRDAATAAEASDHADFAKLVSDLVDEARESLSRTPDQLAVLKKAGVVDAGAKGFVSMLEGVLYFVEGITLAVDAQSENGQGGTGAAGLVEYPAEEEQYRFCTEALVRGEDLPDQIAVREVLREMGDSLIVIRADDVLKIHVHTDEPEEVFDYLRGVGNLVTHKAEDMQAQHAALSSGGHIQLARRPVAIVTDSAADLSEEIIRAHGIHVVPMTLVDGDQEYLDGIDITATDFHQRLVGAADSLPTTSQPTPGAILSAYQQAGEEGESIVGVFLSSTLSGTYQAAEAAAARFDSVPIELADSLGASLLCGLLTLKAAELAELGTPPAEIVGELRRIRAQSGILFTVRTFERMIASGRVGRGKAFIGRFLGIKPVMGMTPDGKVLPFGQAFGEGRARDALLGIVQDKIAPSATKVRFGVVHVGIPEIVPEITSRLRQMYGEHVEILSAPATSVIATHLGVGAWGVAYLVED